MKFAHFLITAIALGANLVTLAKVTKKLIVDNVEWTFTINVSEYGVLRANGLKLSDADSDITIEPADDELSIIDLDTLDNSPGDENSKTKFDFTLRGTFQPSGRTLTYRIDQGKYFSLKNAADLQSELNFQININSLDLNSGLNKTSKLIQFFVLDTGNQIEFQNFKFTVTATAQKNDSAVKNTDPLLVEKERHAIIAKQDQEWIDNPLNRSNVMFLIYFENWQVRSRNPKAHFISSAKDSYFIPLESNLKNSDDFVTLKVNPAFNQLSRFKNPRIYFSLNPLSHQNIKLSNDLLKIPISEIKNVGSNAGKHGFFDISIFNTRDDEWMIPAKDAYKMRILWKNSSPKLPATRKSNR